MSKDKEKNVTPDADLRFPFKPGDWVMNQSGRVAKVKAIDHIAGETTFDLILYSRAGTKIGRESPRSEEQTSELQSLMRISYAVFCLQQKKKDTQRAH